MPPASYVNKEQTETALTLIRTALNTPGRVPVDLRVRDDGCILDNAHKLNVYGYQPRHSQRSGVKTYDYAHRIVFRAKHGPASLDGNREVDHICRTTECLNIDHMQPVTKRENIALGVKDRGNDVDVAAQFFWVGQDRCDASELAKGMNIGVSRARDLIANWRANEAAKKQTS